MSILYSIGIYLYYLLVRMVSPWNRKARQWITGRKQWEKKLKGVFSPGDEVIWFHCASLGEFEQGRPLMERIRQEQPDCKLLLTFFSPSGYNKRKDYDQVDHVCYLPLDTKKNARKFLDQVPVRKVLFIKYEFWYHFLKEINTRQIDLYLASGNFQASHLFFKWYGSWYRKVFQFFTHLFVQDDNSMKLLQGIGMKQVSVVGDTRFDRVASIAEKHKEHKTSSLFAVQQPVIVAGSTWDKDELLLAAVRDRLEYACNWIIAPHEINSSHLEKLKERFPDSCLYSDIQQGRPCEVAVVIVDTIGHLSYLYHQGSVAYIGGGFGKGIHNILEPAAAGMPVFFGPNFQRFREACELKNAGSAYVVEHTSEFLSSLSALLKNEKALKEVSQVSEKYVLSNLGATKKIVDFVFKNKP